ncbi:metallophosphoesterase [Methylophaga thalassica]|uniref:metallophosphoesterase n=1 Tax=Methylophaga TaxID=40222 RepID=UPI002E7BF763|nr:metallophosphoesterase [Methylophaga thalassica]WVI86415.1 metallophosphoesterase [Methylophaga thalassica]
MKNMKIGLISDIHNEFIRYQRGEVPNISNEKGFEVLVLAGDIDCQGYGAEYAVRQSELLGIPVIYILGNHEYYDQYDDKEPVVDKVRKIIHGTQVTLLNNATVDIGEVRFIGSTLWSDYQLFDSPVRNKMARDYASVRLNDFNHIKRLEQDELTNINVEDVVGWHQEARAFITGELNKEPAKKKVVVTHHAPMAACLSEKFTDEILAACYASNLDGLIKQYSPAAWLYGHVHGNNSFKVNQTLIQRQARGYPDIFESIDNGYKPALVHI